jgi:acylphosphatase
LQKLLKDLNNGPRAAHVVKLEKKEIDVIDGESSFIAR